MSDTLRFVCYTTHSPEISEAVRELKEFFDKSDQEKEFLKKRLESIEKERKDKWEAIEKVLLTNNLITQKEADDYAVILGNKMTEIFIEEESKGGGLGDFIKNITGLR